MKKESSRSVLLPLIIVPVGGLLTLGICYVLYFALYMLVETQFFAANPAMVPAGIIRNSYAAAVLVLCLVLLRTRMPDLLKAIVFVGPMIDSIVKNGAAGEKELTSPEMMTFDVTGTDASMRIIFQNAVKDESTTPANYDGTMIILLRFN